MERKKQSIWFWIVNGLIALVILLFIVQNWGMVTFNFLGIKLEGYGFLVFLIIFFLGFFSGWFWSYNRNRRKNKMQKADSRETHYIEE